LLEAGRHFATAAIEAELMWGKRDDTIIYERSPFNAEAARSALAESDITPVDTFYSRNHGPIPDIATDRWCLTVGGLVERELNVTFAELTSRFPSHSVVATLQCAGNRRDGFNEVREIAGKHHPWGPGATSTAEWRGAHLADVLDAAGVRHGECLHVAFSAPDVAPEASPVQTYGSSIPLSKALSEEVLLAWEMNSEPLPRVHGGPVRVVVPGYIAARSVKWITGITVQNEPSDNYFQATAYRILPADFDPDTARPGEGIPLSSAHLNCDILAPDDGSTVPAGPLTVAGYALAGDGHGIARVDVSLDNGHTWRQADLAPEQSRWSWRRWSLVVTAAPGALSVTARAWDSTGATQPESAASLWNPHGYANTSWVRVNLTVA
jgi:sulfite oxidase